MNEPIKVIGHSACDRCRNLSLPVAEIPLPLVWGQQRMTLHLQLCGDCMEEAIAAIFIHLRGDKPLDQ